MTVNRYGNPVFEEGDELYVHFPEIPGYTIRLKAVKAKHDDVFWLCFIQPLQKV